MQSGFYKEIQLNDSHWTNAQTRVNSTKVYAGSHRGSQANQVGFLGEVVAEEWFRDNRIRFEDCRESTKLDYRVGKGFTVDVKTKDRTVPPRINFDNSVPLYNHSHQRPQFYLFISLLRDKKFEKNNIQRYRKAYIVGGIEIEKLDREGKKWNAGDIDPDNGTKFWTACINVSMLQLIPFHELVEIWR